MYVLDPNLQQYATEAQWEKLKATAEHGSERAAAEFLGIHRRAIWSAKQAVARKAAMHGYAPEHDMVHSVPDGFKLRGTSTLYDSKTGEAKIQWVKSQIDRERQAEMFEEAMKALASNLPQVPEIPWLSKLSKHSNDLHACYPVGDHHTGMLAWGEETGGDSYDIKIAEKLITQAINHLVKGNVICRTATVAFLGDFMHYDSFEAVTPTSRNQLDSDSRFPKMVRAAIRSMRYTIEEAARTHEYVHVIVEIGNHDLSSSIFLMECLSNIYENNPRITVDTSPSHFHYFSFGNSLIGTHHGHGVKMEKLPLIMAIDRPDLWGNSEHRFWWTGHIHHDQIKDFEGCRVESFSVLGPTDAWAAQKGYRASRSMKSILLHSKYGEVSRHTVSPSMLHDYATT